MQTNVFVQELAPDVFAYLRMLDGVTKEKIKKSLNPRKNVSAVF